MKKAHLEWHVLLLVTLALVAFGLVMVYSASSGVAVLSNRDPLSVLAKQAVYAAIGVVGAGGIPGAHAPRAATPVHSSSRFIAADHRKGAEVR